MVSFKLPKQHQLNNHDNLQFEDWDDWNI